MLCAEPTDGGGPDNPPPLFLRKLAQRIREEFEYFPGLRLTAGEAARFWGLDILTCQQVLTELLGAGFLARESGRYLKRSA